VRTIEALARARPALFTNPFDHIEPDTIMLKTAMLKTAM